MLKFFRGKRFDVKTTLIVLVLIAVFWGLVMWANVLDFIPVEFSDLRPDTLG